MWENSVCDPGKGSLPFRWSINSIFRWRISIAFFIYQQIIFYHRCNLSKCPTECDWKNGKRFLNKYSILFSKRCRVNYACISRHASENEIGNYPIPYNMIEIHSAEDSLACRKFIILYFWYLSPVDDGRSPFFFSHTNSNVVHTFSLSRQILTHCIWIKGMRNFSIGLDIINKYLTFLNQENNFKSFKLQEEQTNPIVEWMNAINNLSFSGNVNRAIIRVTHTHTVFITILIIWNIQHDLRIISFFLLHFLFVLFSIQTFWYFFFSAMG